MSVAAAPPRARWAEAVEAVRLLAVRTAALSLVELQKLRHDHTELLTRTVQPLLWLLVFGQVFGRLRAIPHVEARILAGLREAGTDTTVVVIAYRMATIALADEVVYLERGRVSARGTHAELMRDSEGYRRLVTAYQRDAEERERMRRVPASEGAA